MSKNECAKSRPVNDPYEVWQRNGWEWRVLKKYQTPEKEATNPYARWFCWVSSPFCPEGELGDSYAHEIMGVAVRVK